MGEAVTFCARTKQKASERCCGLRSCGWRVLRELLLQRGAVNDRFGGERNAFCYAEAFLSSALVVVIEGRCAENSSQASHGSVESSGTTGN